MSLQKAAGGGWKGLSVYLPSWWGQDLSYWFSDHWSSPDSIKINEKLAIVSVCLQSTPLCISFQIYQYVRICSQKYKPIMVWKNLRKIIKIFGDCVSYLQSLEAWLTSAAFRQWVNVRKSSYLELFLSVHYFYSLCQIRQNLFTFVWLLHTTIMSWIFLPCDTTSLCSFLIFCLLFHMTGSVLPDPSPARLHCSLADAI